MSDDRIAMLRASLDAFNATGEIATAGLAPDFEMHQASSILDSAGVFTGPSALRRAVDELRGSFENLRFEIDQVAEAPGGDAVLTIRVTGRGRGSNIEIDNTIAWVVTFDEGLVKRLIVHEDPGEVLTDGVALVKLVIDALNRGDWDSALSRAGSDFEYDLTRTSSPLRGVYGAGQMRRVMNEFLGSWASVRYEPHEFIERGDHFVVPFTTHFRGRDGIELSSDATWVWRVRDGALQRLTLFQDLDDALAAVDAE